MLEQSFTCRSSESLSNNFAFIKGPFKPEQLMNVPIAGRLVKTTCSYPRQRTHLFLKSLPELTNLYTLEYKSRSKTIIAFHAGGGSTQLVKIGFFSVLFSATFIS